MSQFQCKVGVKAAQGQQVIQSLKHLQIQTDKNKHVSSYYGVPWQKQQHCFCRAIQLRQSSE